MPTRQGLRVRPGWNRWCVPLGLHGDGVSVVNVRGSVSKTIDVLSWSSLLSSGPTSFTSYLVYFAFTHTVKKTGLATTNSRYSCNTSNCLWDRLYLRHTFVAGSVSMSFVSCCSHNAAFHAFNIVRRSPSG